MEFLSLMGWVSWRDTQSQVHHCRDLPQWQVCQAAACSVSVSKPFAFLLSLKEDSSLQLWKEDATTVQGNLCIFM